MSLPPNTRPFRAARRHALGALATALAAAVLRPGQAFAQWMMNAPPGVDARVMNTPEGVLKTILAGASMQRGRVKIDLPRLAENGHSVALTVRVESPMSDADHVRSIDLVSDKNPIPHMASFILGARAGRAEVGTRVRLNGTQRVTAIAKMSDDSVWYDTFDVSVTEASCTDGG